MIHNKVNGFNFPEYYQLVVGNVWGEQAIVPTPGEETPAAIQALDLTIKDTPLQFNKAHAYRDMVGGMIDENSYDLNPFAFPFTTSAIVFHLVDYSQRKKIVYYNDVVNKVFNGVKSFDFEIKPALYPGENKVYVKTESGEASRIFTFSCYNAHLFLAVAAQQILAQRVESDNIRHNFVLEPNTIISEIGT